MCSMAIVNALISKAAMSLAVYFLLKNFQRKRFWESCRVSTPKPFSLTLTPHTQLIVYGLYQNYVWF